MRQLLHRSSLLSLPTWANWYTLGPLVWVALLLLLAPYQSLTRELWTDEAFTISYTAHPSLGLVLEDVRKNEETPPVYFVLVWLWSWVAGSSVAAVRLLSLLFSALAVALMALMLRRWLPAASSGMVGFLLAVLTPLGLYVFTARSYALMFLMAVICIGAFEWVFRRPNHPPALVAYSLAMGIFCLTSYFALAFVAAHNLIWLVALLRNRADWRRRLLGWAAAQCAIVLLVLPWLPALYYQFWAAKFVTATENIVLSDYFWQLFTLPAVPPSSSFWTLIWLPLTLLTWALIAIGLRASSREDAGLTLRAFGVPLITQMCLIIWMQAVAWRYLTILLPSAMLAAVVGLSAVQRKIPKLGRMLAITLLAGMFVYRLSGVLSPNVARSWPELIETATRQIDATHDAVLFNPPWEQRTFEYYHHDPALKLLGTRNYDDFFTSGAHDFRQPWTVADVISGSRGSRRLWVFDYQTVGVPPMQVPYKVLDHWESGKLSLVLYEVPATP